MTDPDPPATERFTDDLRPELVAQAPTYSTSPIGPVRRAPLSDSTGTQLGSVWTDDQAAAGWDGAEPTPAVVRAGAYVWRVLAIAHDCGEPVSVVLDPQRYAPLYKLGDPVT